MITQSFIFIQGWVYAFITSLSNLILLIPFLTFCRASYDIEQKV